jgi:hypothetical protein
VVFVSPSITKSENPLYRKQKSVDKNFGKSPQKELTKSIKKLGKI